MKVVFTLPNMPVLNLPFPSMVHTFTLTEVIYRLYFAISLHTHPIMGFIFMPSSDRTGLEVKKCLKLTVILKPGCIKKIAYCKGYTY